MFSKKLGVTALGFIIAAGMTGCGNTENNDISAAENADSKSFSIVCTIFPEYDWVREILGGRAENADITYLLDKGIDLHSFQPTADDIMKISSCDMFVYVGGESDEWVEDTLSDASNKDMMVINLMDILGDAAKVEEFKEGMQEEDEEDDGGTEETEYDEHIWLSLKNAEILCTEIEKNIAAIDPENSDEYKSNLETYISQLNELDGDFRELIDSSSVKTLIFGDRFPFRYFVDDYGLDYYAAFVGCSAETEASFETIAFLADKIKELDCDTVFTLENSDKSIADTVIRTSGKYVKIAELNSIQSVSKSDIDNGATYLSLMRRNYDVLKDIMK
ncbi:MAG: zinc ABC transporter substrate-binding protein [Ruminococcus sp.]|nr:zinc ABC transporter substrate-binding protein [Ruminococcus sp.]